MEQIKAEIPGPMQPPEESKALSVQPTKLKETGESSIEMSDSANTMFSLKNATEKIINSYMAGLVNGGMSNDNSTNNFHMYLGDEVVSKWMARLNEGGSDNTNNVAREVFVKPKDFYPERSRRTSETEISLGSRREVASTRSTVMEDPASFTSAVQPNKKKNCEQSINDDVVDGSERCLQEGVKLEGGTATPEIDQQTDTNKSTGTCSSSEVPFPESNSYSCSPSSCIATPRSQEIESSNSGTSTSPTNVENSYREEGRSTSSQPICSPSDDTNPWSKSSKKGPGNTVAEKPNSEGEGSLTSISSLFEEITTMNPRKRFMVETIVNLLITLAENLPNMTMMEISKYLFACLESAMINPSEDESVPGKFISLTDFKELEKKLRKLDDFILNVDVPVIVNIASLGPQMLPEIVKYLNSFRAATPVAVSTVSAVSAAAADEDADAAADADDADAADDDVDADAADDEDAATDDADDAAADDADDNDDEWVVVPKDID